MRAFPVPGTGDARVAVTAPGAGPGNWAGAPSAAFAGDGSIVIAYRLRTPDNRGARVVIATSADGANLSTIAFLDKERFAAESLERPAVVRTDAGWRLYMSCATPGTKHWRSDARIGVKDPVVRCTNSGWKAWICCHSLDERDAEDRMTTAFATSDDGLDWRWHGEVMSGRPGRWDARGVRVTSVLADGRASYNGRATKEENFSERTGIALPRADGRLEAEGETPIADVRYLDLVPDPNGGLISSTRGHAQTAATNSFLSVFEPFECRSRTAGYLSNLATQA